MKEPFFVEMRVDNDELEKTLNDLKTAIKTISDSIYKLESLGFIHIQKNEDAASGN